MRRLIAALIAAAAVTGCSASQEQAPSPSSTVEAPPLTAATSDDVLSCAGLTAELLEANSEMLRLMEDDYYATEAGREESIDLNTRVAELVRQSSELGCEG